MKQQTKKVKDKKIRAFEATLRTVWGFERVFKKYVHSEESGGLWAYVRHLSEKERYIANAMQNDEDIVIEVAFNPKITTDLMIEFGDKTYKIVSIDPFEFNKTDLVIRAKEVAAQTYDEIEWGEL